MKDFDLRKYLAEGKLLKEEIMIDTTVMVDPNNTLMSNASDEEIDYVKANLTNVPKMSVEDFQEKYDEYFDRFYSEGDPLDLQIKALQIHIDKGVLTREEAIEALAMLQGQDVEEFEDMFLAEGRLLKEDQMMGKYIQTKHPDGYDMIMSFSMPDEGELGLDYGTLDEILEVKEINGVKVYCVYI